MLEMFDSQKIYLGTKTFDCGLEAVNSFIRKGNLKTHSKHDFNKSYVVIQKIDEKIEKDKNKRGDKIIAFYTMQAFSIERSFMQGQYDISLPMEIPAVRICMLGVDKTFQRKGIAKNLIYNAIQNVRSIQNTFGVTGIYLDADSKAVDFYTKLGFNPLTEIQELKETPMFLRVTNEIIQN